MLIVNATLVSPNTYDVKLNGNDLIYDVIFRWFPSMQAFAEYLCEAADSKSCQLTLKEGETVRTIMV